MRNAVNNLQSTFSGFGYVNAVRASVPLWTPGLCLDVCICVCVCIMAPRFGDVDAVRPPASIPGACLCARVDDLGWGGVRSRAYLSSPPEPPLPYVPDQPTPAHPK